MAVQSTMQANGHIESFNGKLRDECLNTHWFTSLRQARKVVKLAAVLKVKTSSILERMEKYT